MATLYRRENGTYYANYSLGGQRIRRSFKTRDEKLAHLALGELEAKLERSGLGLEAPDCLVGLFLERYQKYSRLHKCADTCKHGEVILNRFFNQVGNSRLGTISPSAINTYQSRRLEQVKRSTVHREMQLIRAAFRWAVKMGFLTEDPCARVQKLQTERRFVEYVCPQKLELLLQAVQKDIPCHGRGGKGRGNTKPRKTPLYPMVAVAAFAGLRLGEILHLQWEDVNLDGGIIAIRFKGDFRPKSRKERLVPVCSRLADILLDHQKKIGIKQGLVYSTANGMKLERSNALKELKSVANRLRLRCNWQILRHSFASNLVAAGVSIYLVSKLLGHASVTTTERHYAHLAPTDHKAELDEVFSRDGSAIAA